MDQPTTLLPCPWCGGPAAIDLSHAATPYEAVPTEYFINCSHEGTTCPVSHVFVGPCPTVGEAMQKWNTRHTGQ